MCEKIRKGKKNEGKVRDSGKSGVVKREEKRKRREKENEKESGCVKR